MKKPLPIVILAIVALVAFARLDLSTATRPAADPDRGVTTGRSGPERAPRAPDPQTETQLRDSGIVVKVLPDDNDGSRHQRFILRRESGGSVLVAHNIDLAPRVESLERGDLVEFYGEFEANAKGGVVHWTHHDPAGRHVDGWLRHEGRTYQ